MSNLTQVGITSGIPTSGTGTVSTIDGLIATGVPITGLPTGANNIGNVSITSSANIALATSNNIIGIVNAIASGLPTGANTIGAVTNAPANNKIGIVQIGNSSGGVIDSFGISGNVAGITANVTASVNNFPTGFSVNAGLPTGANTIGAISSVVANVTVSVNNFPIAFNQTTGLPTGANTIGAVASIVAGLPTGANTIGAVASVVAGLPTGANTIGAVTLAVANNKVGIVQIGNSTGGVVDIFGGSLSGNIAGVTANVNLGTSTNFIGSINALSSGLPTGANTIGSVILAVANNKMGIVQIGNSTGGVVDVFGGSLSGNIAGITSNATVVVNNFPTAFGVNAGLPTGANTIGGVTLAAGLPTGANTIGAVASIVANVVLGTSTNFIGSINALSSGLPTGANTIGSVVVAGLPTGANTIGTVTLGVANNKMGIVQIGNSTGGVVDIFGGSLSGNIAGITANIFLGTGSNLIGNVQIQNLGQNLASVSVPVTLNSDPDIRNTYANITVTDSVSVTTFGGFNNTAIITGTPTAGSFASQAINGQSTVSVHIKGPWTGTVAFEASRDFANTWVTTTMRGLGTAGNGAVGSITGNTTANGAFIGEVTGATNFRIRATSTIVGNVVPQMLFSQQPGAVTVLNPLRIVDNASGAQATILPANTQASNNSTAMVVAIHPLSVNPDGQSTMANSAPVVIASDQSTFPVTVSGDVASATTDSGNPVKLGVAVQQTANPSPTIDGNRINVWGDKVGRIMTGHVPRVLKAVGGNTFTAITTNKTIIPAAGTLIFTDLYGLIIENTSAANTEVLVSDGTNIFPFMVPAADTRGFMLPADSAIPATTNNIPWTANCTTSVTSVKITAFYVKNV